MPPKKAAGASKKAAPAAHASYRDMITDAIVNLKERNGSSRQAIKKYVTSNNQINVAYQATFDAQFNKAIKAGVDKGEFTQPKGPSGSVKLAKKEPAAKPAAKVTKTTTDTTKALAAKKAATKKTTAKATIKPAVKKTGPNKAMVKPKANSGNIRRTTLAPAVVEQPKVIIKTKSGRVTKTTAPPAKAARKKPTTKK
ncbi:Histone H1 [Penicillium cosmopolitanum]|uniref:Histone H1 n=1 Tax=Penicillium cosmopolitanum TaxID=1131564 RepID=A0A9W9WCF4_9EURO|nr:Histone H1 [Penicillium cosmopolitanum]KAJ5414955.1 Histone H1 [Penicillium cosmopolitanum]